MKKLHHSLAAGLFTVPVVVLLLGAGCSSGTTTTTDPPAATNTANVTTNTNDADAAFNACQLYSQIEAEAVLGVAVVPPDPAAGEIFRHASNTNYYCVHATADTGATKKSVWVGIDRYTTAGSARAGFDGQKARLDRTTEVTGYGDAAYWDSDQGFLRVMRGSDIFTTQVLSGVTGSQEKATTIMQTVLGRVQ